MNGDRREDLIAEVFPEYFGLIDTADKAKALRVQLENQPVRRFVPPATAEQLTNDWLDGEINRQLGNENIEARLRILKEVENTARQDALELHRFHRDDLIHALAAQLDEFVTEISAAMAELAPGVKTASQAIEAGGATVQAWATIHSGVKTYRDIRTVQNSLYPSHEGMKSDFDGYACGDTHVGDPKRAADTTAHGPSDKEARLYYHRNLNTVAPGWKDGAELPWPEDQTERLVWCIRHNSGIWCPTPDEINGAIREVPPRLAGGAPERLTNGFSGHVAPSTQWIKPLYSRR